MTSWWNKNLPARLADFRTWTGGADAPSRVAARKYIVGAGYKSVLDCGCGLGVDCHAYRAESPQIEWFGCEWSEAMLREMPSSVAAKCMHSDIRKTINAAPCQFDVVYARHVLEHLEGYESALAGMVRVARYEVVVVWFLKPELGREQFSYDAAENLHHNRYERGRLEAFLKGLRGVTDVQWEDVGDSESIMHVMLNHSPGGFSSIENPTAPPSISKLMLGSTDGTSESSANSASTSAPGSNLSHRGGTRESESGMPQYTPETKRGKT